MSKYEKGTAILLKGQVSSTKILEVFASHCFYKNKKIFFFAFYAKKRGKVAIDGNLEMKVLERPPFFWYFLNIFVKQFVTVHFVFPYYSCLLHSSCFTARLYSKSFDGELYWTSLLFFALLLPKGKHIWSIFTNPIKLK